MKRIILIAIIMVFLIEGCASASSRQREAYILAKDHGWIELTFKDSQIPGVPRNPKENDFTLVPPYCSIEITVNNEPFLNETIYPFGKESPYRVDTGFRFPVSIGELNLILSYRGCRPVEGEEKEEPEIIPLTLTIEKDMVTQVLYEKGSLTAEDITENKTVTLDEINSRLKIIEEKISFENQ